MRTDAKKICAVLLLFFMLALTSCSGFYGIKKTVSDETKSHTAYYYTRQGEEGTEYCLSLLKYDEELDMEETPNVYISEKDFDFDFSDGLLAIFMEEEDNPKESIEIDGILVAYGYLS